MTMNINCYYISTALLCDAKKQIKNAKYCRGKIDKK